MIAVPSGCLQLQTLKSRSDAEYPGSLLLTLDFATFVLATFDLLDTLQAEVALDVMRGLLGVSPADSFLLRVIPDLPQL